LEDKAAADPGKDEKGKAKSTAKESAKPTVETAKPMKAATSSVKSLTEKAESHK